MVVASPHRVEGDLDRLVHRRADVGGFALAAARILGRAVPFDGVCVLTVDPATLLPTGEVVENGLPAAARSRLAEIEVGGHDECVRRVGPDPAASGELERGDRRGPAKERPAPPKCLSQPGYAIFGPCSSRTR